MNRAEIVRMNKHIYQSFTQTIKLRIILWRKPIGSCHKWIVNKRTKTLNEYLEIFPYIFLFWQPVGVSHFGIIV